MEFKARHGSIDELTWYQNQQNVILYIYRSLGRLFQSFSCCCALLKPFTINGAAACTATCEAVTCVASQALMTDFCQQVNWLQNFVLLSQVVENSGVGSDMELTVTREFTFEVEWDTRITICRMCCYTERKAVCTYGANPCCCGETLHSLLNHIAVGAIMLVGCHVVARTCGAIVLRPHTWGYSDKTLAWPKKKTKGGS